MVHFGEVLKTCSLRSNSVTRQVSFNRTKIGGKCQNVKNSNATFWVIFKQCDIVSLFCTKESWWKMHERKWPTFNAIRETLFKSASDTISGKRQKTRRSARPDIRVEAAAYSILLADWRCIFPGAAAKRRCDDHHECNSNTWWKATSKLFSLWAKTGFETQNRQLKTGFMAKGRVPIRVSPKGKKLKIIHHNVWKSQKKSHSTLRAKRATFTFWVDKS